jgi:hypothetical protein
VTNPAESAATRARTTNNFLTALLPIYRATKPMLDRSSSVASAKQDVNDVIAWSARRVFEHRIELARLVLESVETRDDRVVAFTAQPDLAPFFIVRANENTPADLPGCQPNVNGFASSGSDGIRTRDLGLDRAAC